MKVFEQLDGGDFEQVAFCRDRSTGLHAIIAVHNTQLGPSLGGSRFYPYASEEAALNDALRLANAMTYKASLAGLSLGGGKSVIVGDASKQKTPALMKAFGSFVDRLNGTYITTVDSGTSPEDMNIIRTATKHVVGMSPNHGGSGDPSPSTALGVAEGIRATAKFVYGSDDIQGKRIAIQGVGHVGFPLAKILKELGAKLIVADTVSSNVERAVSELGAQATKPDEILTVECDILAPCAMGGAISKAVLPKLRCQAIAGAANNQLENEEVGSLLMQKGIAYAPDFAINAGGLIHVSEERDGFDPKAVEKKTRNIYNTILTIFSEAKEKKISSSQMAIQLAKRRLA